MNILPDDILTIIFVMRMFERINDITTITLVCRRWRAIFRRQHIWKLLLKLYFGQIEQINHEDPFAQFKIEWRESYVVERFKVGPLYKLSNFNRVATSIDSYYSQDNKWNKIVLGKKSISNGIKIWKVKINKTSNSRIMIGVAPSNIDQGMENAYNKYGYYFHISLGKLYSKSFEGQILPGLSYSGFFGYDQLKTNIKIKEGEILSVELNFVDDKLYFIYKEMRLDVYFSGLPKEAYNLCILLCDSGDQVELVN